MKLVDLAKQLKTIETTQSIEDKFLKEFEMTVMIKDADYQVNKEIVKYHIRPSSLGGCLRNNYYQFIGAEPELLTTQPEMIGISECGTDRHNRIQNTIKRMQSAEWISVSDHLEQLKASGSTISTIVKEVKDNETKCWNPNLNLSFMCDGIVDYMNLRRIIEIKTETSLKFKERKGVEPKHLVQATCYSLALGIDDILFIYEERDKCVKKAYSVHISNQQKQYVINMINRIKYHAKIQTAPPRPEGLSMCTYCPYRERCSKE